MGAVVFSLRITLSTSIPSTFTPPASVSAVALPFIVDAPTGAVNVPLILVALVTLIVPLLVTGLLSVVLASVNVPVALLTKFIFTVSEVKSNVPVLVSVPVPLMVDALDSNMLIPLAVGLFKLLFRTRVDLLISSVPEPTNVVATPAVIVDGLVTLPSLSVFPAAISIVPLLVSTVPVSLESISRL